MKCFGYVFIWIMVLVPLFSPAQKVIYNFERLSMEDGLPSNTIYDIIQDKKGFLWMGTDKGLCRYDGFRMKVFVHDTENPRSISSNLVKRVFEGKDGKIWIASLQTGLSCYDPSLPDEHAFTNYRSNLKDSSTLLNNEIYDVYEDQHGFIWVAGLDTDLQRLNPSTGKFETISLGEKRGGHKSYFRFFSGDDKRYLWLASRYDGFFKFDTETHKAKQYNYKNLANAPENSVGAFAMDGNKLWVSYYNLGLSSLDLVNSVFKPDVFHLGRNERFYDNIIFSLAVGPDQILWGGHGSKGIYLFNTASNESQRIGWNKLTPADTTTAQIEVIFFDRNHVGWIGTSGKGLLKYDPYHNQFNRFSTFSNTRSYGNVKQLIEDGDYIWFHTEKGLGKYSTVRRETDFFIGYDQYQTDVGQLNFINGRVYISTTNKGLWFLDEKKRLLLPIIPFGENELTHADINTVLGDFQEGDSVLWIGSWGGGLFRYDIKTKTVRRFTSKDGMPDDKVIQLAKDPRGYLWLSTQGHGVACIRDKKKMKFEAFSNDPHEPESLPSNTVLCFYTDRHNRFWLGTTTGGIVEVLEEKSRLRFHYYMDNKKFAFQGVHEIAENSAGKLFMLTDHGIALFDPATGRINHQYEKSVHYQTAFPITTIAAHSRYDMLLGTCNGFMTSKTSVSASDVLASAAISGFRIFDQDHSDLLRQGRILLAHDQNFFTIEFSATQYSGAKNVTFAYRLSDVDKEWRFTNKDPSATYTDLHGGDYVFEVNVVNGQGIWNDHPTRLLISITPPVWATVWFRMAAAMLLVMTVYAIHRYRMRQLLVIQRIRNDISKDLHDDVGATLSSIRILSEVAHQKLKEDQQEYASQLMAKVASQASEMADSMSDIIWTFNPYNDHLEKMIHRLQLQFHDLCELKGIYFRAAISTSAALVSLNLDVRKNVYLICKEAINNAMKYADGSLIEVNVTGGLRLLTIDIRDNGKGFVVSGADSGNGVRNMTLRAEEIKAKFLIQSSAAGTEIKIIFNPMRYGYANFNL